MNLNMLEQLWKMDNADVLATSAIVYVRPCKVQCPVADTKME